MEIDAITLFFTLLFSYIAKDFYDIFIQKHVLKGLKKYKDFLENKKENKI